MVVTAGTNFGFYYLHYTIIVFNNYQLAYSNLKNYKITSGLLTLSTSTGTSQVLPTGYNSYFMAGLNGFSGTSNTKYLKYNLQVGTLSNGSYGFYLAA
jgi:hypothetical protein